MRNREKAPWQAQLLAWLDEEIIPSHKDSPRSWRQRLVKQRDKARKETAFSGSKESSSPIFAAPTARAYAEQRLWRQWVQEAGVKPLQAAERVLLERPAPLPRPRQREQDEAAIRQALLAPLTLDDWLEHDSATQFLRPGVPRRVLTEMRRGRWTIRRQLDLHGLTREEARAALGRFLGEALAAGERCVRIVHGKGLGSPGGVSILKHLSRQWLSRREEILAFCEASPQQGGSGALLVLLRAPHAKTS